MTDNLANAKWVYDRIVRKLEEIGKTRKEARQTARQMIPGGIETKILMTGNMRAWRDMLPKRLSPSADREIREVATKILALLKGIAPNTFQDFE
jgi:thymidylate synthase (FAD)